MTLTTELDLDRAEPACKVSSPSIILFKSCLLDRQTQCTKRLQTFIKNKNNLFLNVFLLS